MLTGHHVGWPVARGGSQAIADALASLLRSLGGEIETGRRVECVDELGDAGAVLLDLTPRQVLALAGHRLPGALPARRSSATATAPASSSSTGRSTARSRGRRRSARGAGTVHLGGTLEEIAAVRGRGRARAGTPSARSCCSPSPRSATRAARRRASTPAGPTATCRPARRRDMTERDRGARSSASPPASATACSPAPSMHPAEMEAYNPNYVGGDINGGAQDLRQLFTRPVARPVALHDARPAAVHLLVVDAARRRRARHVRLLGRAGGAQARMSEATSPRSPPTMSGCSPSGLSTIPGRATKAACAPAASAPAQSQAWAAIRRTSPIGTPNVSRHEP